MVSPFLMVPDLTRNRQITPLFFQYQEFTRKRVSSFQGHSAGLAISCTIVSRSFQIPEPVLALTSRGTVCSLSYALIYQATQAGLALGMSILLMTGIILRPQALACQQFVTVCACTPWVASTTSSAPQQDRIDRFTSQLKSQWPGVSTRLRRYSLYFIVHVFAFTVIPRYFQT